MFSNTEELFLCEYFTAEALVGGYCDTDMLFERLGDVFLIPTDRQKELALLCRSEVVAGVHSETEYKQYLRCLQYFEYNDIDSGYTDSERALIAIKGSAFGKLADCEMKSNIRQNKTVALERLIKKANEGTVTALRIWGVLQCEGIVVEKNVPSGIYNIMRTARWNDVPALVELLYYDAEDRQETINRLATVTVNTTYGNLVDCYAKRYGAPAATVKECVLLSKAIGKHVVKDIYYEPWCANLLSSTIVEIADKEKILLTSDSKSVINSLPLKLEYTDIEYRTDALSDLPLKREKECEAIIAAAGNNDLRNVEAFKPICICSDSDYIIDRYASAISSMFENAHIGRFEMRNLAEDDFYLNLNNAFIRECDDGRDNVYMLFFQGNASETVKTGMLDFIQTPKRTKFKLIEPNVSLDLGAIYPICFCDSKNKQMLSEYCNIIEVKNATVEERKSIVKALFEEKRETYGISAITADTEAIDKLASAEPDDIRSTLENVIFAKRRKGEELHLTLSDVTDYFKKPDEKRRIGFGGAKNDK